MDAVFGLLREGGEDGAHRAVGPGNGEPCQIVVPGGGAAHRREEAHHKGGGKAVGAREAAAVRDDEAAGVIDAEVLEDGTECDAAGIVVVDGVGTPTQRAEEGFRVEVVAAVVGFAADSPEGGGIGLADALEAVLRDGPFGRGCFESGTDELPGGDVSRSACCHDAAFDEEFVEMVGAGQGAEFIAEMLGPGLPVDGEGAADFADGREVGGKQVEFVPRPGRCRDPGTGIIHPGRLRRPFPPGYGLSDLPPRAHREFFLILIIAEAVPAGAIVGAEVFPIPFLVLDGAVKPAAVTDNPPLDAFDARAEEEILPPGEQGEGGDGNAVGSGNGRIAATDDIEVSLEGAILDFAAIADGGLELEIAAECVQSCPRRDELHVGSGYHPDTGIPPGKGVALGIHRQHAPDRSLERLLPGHAVDVGLRLGLRPLCPRRQRQDHQ